MNRLLHAWHSFWFQATPVRRLGAFRVALCGFAFLDASIGYTFIQRYARVDGEFYRPILLLRAFHVPRPTPAAVPVIRLLIVAALLCATIGLATRLALAIAAPLYTWWFAFFYSFGAFQHKHLPLVIGLWVLMLAPSGLAYSVDALRGRLRQAGREGRIPPPSQRWDPLAGWALRMVMVLVVAAYMFAAYSKLRASGVGWVTGGALDDIIVEKQLPLGLALGSVTAIVYVMAALTIVLEGTAFLAFFGGRIRDGYLLVAAAFHVGTKLVLGINFQALVLCYLAFYKLEAGTARAGAWLRRIGARFGPTVDVLYDTAHARAATALAIFDVLGRFRLVDVTDAAVPPAGASAVHLRLTNGTHSDELGPVHRFLAKLPVLWPLLPGRALPAFAHPVSVVVPIEAEPAVLVHEGGRAD